jgi:hypothetical protein
MMARRKITCPCGHPMTAANDAALFRVARRHVDDRHPELGLTDASIRKMIVDEAIDA